MSGKSKVQIQDHTAMRLLVPRNAGVNDNPYRSAASTLLGRADHTLLVVQLSRNR